MEKTLRGAAHNLQFARLRRRGGIPDWDESIDLRHLREPFQSQPVLPGPHPFEGRRRHMRGRSMNGLIYLIGLIVVIMAILSFFGLR
jgi:hypothetical protein